MNNKKSRAARSAAAVLAVVGIAGLSMAAASQLGMSWDGQFQAGTAQVNAACQDETTVKVGFEAPSGTPSGTLPWTIGKLQFSGVLPACKDLNYRVDYKTKDATTWVNLVKDDKVTLTGDVLAVSLGSVDPQKITQVALTILS